MELVLESDTGSAVAINDKNEQNNGEEFLKNVMISEIAEENKAFFKSQQIGDPELDLNERKHILENVLNTSHSTFLARFGPYLKTEHLQYFETHNYNNTEDNYEIHHYISEIKKTHSRFNINIRNRRFEAMQKMIKEHNYSTDNYFSDIEMMKREPLLYEQLVGQYLTDGERRNRDRTDVNDDGKVSFLNVLLKGIDTDQTEELKMKQLNEEKDHVEEDDDDDDTNHGLFIRKTPTNDGDCGEDSDEDKFPKIPPSFRKQWGNFDEDPVLVAEEKKTKDKFKYVTSAERNLLKEEFLGIMYSKFLSGYDKDFDYSKIDEDPDLDNLKIIAQDEEDKYFDSEEGNDIRVNTNSTSNASEDELDVYMKKLKDDETQK